jgi:pyruvate dehydrogenase E2 component (dihydrolipoyllysine-residue acetyltransferase)
MSQGPEPAAPPARGASTTVEPSKAQKVIARRMAASRSTVPDFVLRTSVDMEAAVALRAERKAAAANGHPVPSLNDLIVKAAALALREHPYANGSFVDDTFELHERVNVGVAMAATGLLVVPVIRDADSKPLSEIAAETRELADLVRSGKIAPPQLSGGTFTVSNLGMYGIEDFDAVVNPPQAAILSVGKVMAVPVASGEGVEVRQRARLGLSCDHRILYGADAAGFLARLGELIERPGWAEVG